jgi:hypothetical protein
MSKRAGSSPRRCLKGWGSAGVTGIEHGARLNRAVRSRSQDFTGDERKGEREKRGSGWGEREDWRLGFYREAPLWGSCGGEKWRRGGWKGAEELTLSSWPREEDDREDFGPREEIGKLAGSSDGPEGKGCPLGIKIFFQTLQGTKDIERKI